MVDSESGTMSQLVKLGEDFESINDLVRLLEDVGSECEIVEEFSATEALIELPHSSFFFFIGEPITIFFGFGNCNIMLKGQLKIK